MGMDAAEPLCGAKPVSKTAASARRLIESAGMRLRLVGGWIHACAGMTGEARGDAVCSAEVRYGFLNPGWRPSSQGSLGLTQG